jgi:hypothetical protein
VAVVHILAQALAAVPEMKEQAIDELAGQHRVAAESLSVEAIPLRSVGAEATRQGNDLPFTHATPRASGCLPIRLARLRTHCARTCVGQKWQRKQSKTASGSNIQLDKVQL